MPWGKSTLRGRKTDRIMKAPRTKLQEAASFHNLMIGRINSIQAQLRGVCSQLGYPRIDTSLFYELQVKNLEKFLKAKEEAKKNKENL